MHGSIPAREMRARRAPAGRKPAGASGVVNSAPSANSGARLPKVEVITGVNLPMILKLATARADSLALRAAAELVTSYGQKNITLASELLRTRARSNRS